MVTVYRVVREKYADRPLDTEGNRLYGGRWNPPGTGVLYTAEHPALALVEILVHAPRVTFADLPAYRLFRLDVPEDSIRRLEPDQLPGYWNDGNYGRSQYILNDWLNEPDVLALGVPSSVLPSGVNYLLHASHPLYSQVRIIDSEPLLIDARLWPAKD